MRKNQQGASYIAILIAVIGFAFLVKIAIAVWGPYVDDRVDRYPDYRINAK